MDKKTKEDGGIVDKHQEQKRDEAHEDVFDDFYKYYNWIEFNLPRKIQNIDKVELWKLFCDVYQKAFVQCREAILTVFMELFEEDGQPREKEIDYVQTAYQYLVKYSHLSILNKEFLKKEITSLTELSFQEQQNRQINWNKQENLKAAYWYLLQHCQPVLNEEEISGMIVDKILAPIKVDEKLFPILRQQTIKAVEICWRMQMLSPPMFICQPTLFNEDWHNVHGGSWYNKTNELVYYRPVLMYAAGGTVAHKGFVGNKPPTTNLPTTIADHEITENTCSSAVKDIPPMHEIRLKKPTNDAKDVVSAYKDGRFDDMTAQSDRCCYCRVVFQSKIKAIKYKAGKFICVKCNDKIHELICFTCGKKIEKGINKETNTGLHHSFCLICRCVDPVKGASNKCGRCTKSLGPK